jgi:hypothetical protein
MWESVKDKFKIGLFTSKIDNSRTIEPTVAFRVAQETGCFNPSAGRNLKKTYIPGRGQWDGIITF